MNTNGISWPAILVFSGPCPQAVVGSPDGKRLLNAAAPAVLKALAARGREALSGEGLPVRNASNFMTGVIAVSDKPKGRFSGSPKSASGVPKCAPAMELALATN